MAPGCPPPAPDPPPRAAWSPRPPRNPPAARRPASAEMLASREPTRYRYLTPIRDQEKFHERDAEALAAQGRPDRLDHLQPAGKAQRGEPGDVADDAGLCPGPGHRRQHPGRRPAGRRR